MYDIDGSEIHIFKRLYRMMEVIRVKGIILEIIGNHAVVLTKAGDYKKVRLKNSMNYECGDEIEMNKSIFNWELPKLQWKQYRVRFSIMAILFIIMIFPSINYYQTNQVAGHVNIDINPSVELTYNKQMKVIGAHSLNDDGEALLSKKEVLKMNVHDAINSLIVVAIEEGYIASEKDNGIIISITDIKGELYKEELSKQIAESTKDVQSIKVEYVDSDVETFEKAQKLKKSPGEVIIEEKIGLSHQEVENEKMTTYELVSRYNEYKDALTEENSRSGREIVYE